MAAGKQTSRHCKLCKISIFLKEVDFKFNFKFQSWFKAIACAVTGQPEKDSAYLSLADFHLVCEKLR